MEARAADSSSRAGTGCGSADAQGWDARGGRVGVGVDARVNTAVRAPLPSPPASAAPGLKGFMARFRKQRAAPEALSTPQSHQSSLHQGNPSTSATSARSTVSSGSSTEPSYGQMPHSAPALQTVFRSQSPLGSPAPPQSPTPKPIHDYLGLHSRGASQTNSDEDAIKQ